MRRTRHYTFLAILLIGFACLIAQSSAFAQNSPHSSHRSIQLTSQKIKLPFGNAVFPGGEAAEVVNSHCLMCHSKDFIDAQPPLSLAAWKKEVDKMRTVYACPLRADQAESVAEFVSKATSATFQAAPAASP